MKSNLSSDRYLLIGHILSMAFGLAGLLLVLPNPNFIANLPEFGKTAFAWSMAGGGVAYMLLGTAAVAVYAYRTIGLWHWLGFMIPAIALSLCSELLGTSTGFPFGHYRYLAGLGYKIGGLVPFTIPLSWFYLGFSAYLLARAGLQNRQMPDWLRYAIAISFGAILLTSWDFVLDPAMSQTTMPFWVWDQPGAFFGMPYQNFAGWLGTSVVFMSVATLLWSAKPLTLPKSELGLPLAIYLSNFAFAAIMSLGSGFYIPVLLGTVSGAIPAIAFYRMARSNAIANVESSNQLSSPSIPVGAMPK
jgi:uncharacterized membrane protein